MEKASENVARLANLVPKARVTSSYILFINISASTNTDFASPDESSHLGAVEILADAKQLEDDGN